MILLFLEWGPYETANYNGKKYYGNKLRGMCELRSLTKDDAEFHSKILV